MSVRRKQGRDCRGAPASFSSLAWRAQSVASPPSPSSSPTASRDVRSTANGPSENGRWRPWRAARTPNSTPANSGHGITQRKALELPRDLTQRLPKVRVTRVAPVSLAARMVTWRRPEHHDGMAVLAQRQRIRGLHLRGRYYGS